MTQRLTCLLGAFAALALAADEPRISGPFTHENLSIYLLHAGAPPAKSRLRTLREAMAANQVVVSESGTVNSLWIENLSSEEVYIQSGDIVKGGQQDRVLTTDLVLPPHSGRLPISAFCVEHGRWTQRGAEPVRQFASSSMAISGTTMRKAVRQKDGQQAVWNEVAATQSRIISSGIMAAVPAASPTSMQLTLESRPVIDATAAYIKALIALVDASDDVAGFAYAINGQVSSADVYASPDLFRKMWPKLLQAGATEAVAERRNARNLPPPPAQAVKTALMAADRAREASKEHSGRLTVVKKESEKMTLFESQEAGSSRWLHQSYIAK